MSQNQEQDNTPKIAGKQNSSLKIRGDYNTFFSISPQELAKYWNIPVEALRTIKFDTSYKELNEAIAEWQQAVNSRDNFLYRFFMGKPEDTINIVIKSNGDYYGVPFLKIYPPVNGNPDRDRDHEIEKEGYGPYMLSEVIVTGKKGNTPASDTTQTTATPATKVTKQQAQQKTVEPKEEDLVDGTPYTVKGGDTIWDIAKSKLKKKSEKVSNKQILQYVQQIMNVNNITDQRGIIYVGDSLTLPEFDSSTPAYQPPQKQSSKKKKEEELPTVYLKEDHTGNTPYKENDDYVVGKSLSNPSPTPTININIPTPQDRLSTVKQTMTLCGNYN